MNASNNSADALDSILRQADDQFLAGDKASAERTYQNALEAFGPNPTTLIRLADIAVQAGRLDQAQTHVRGLRTHFPDFEWTPMVEAELATAQLDFDRAVELYREALERMPNFGPVKNRLERLVSQLAMEREWHAPVDMQEWQAQPRDGRPDFRSAAPEDRVLVVSWDIGHNVVGRGITMAETICDARPTALAGPYFPMYGDGLWPPLADSLRQVPIFGWHAPYFRQLLEGALRMVRDWPVGTVWVSKPRFPGLLIGLLYREIHGATLLCDIDDDELAFVKGKAPRSLEAFVKALAPQEWTRSQGHDWTELGMDILSSVDGLTACNPALCETFDATLVRHGRNGTDARTAIAARPDTRAEFGFADDDRVVLFLGTPRRHKGLLDLARAVIALDRPEVVLCIAGSVVDPAMEKELAEMPGLRLKRLPAQPFARVLDLNAMADVVVLLQDPDSAISQSQTPAKLTDAVAVGSTVLITDVPPVADVITAGAALPIRRDDTLADRLAEALDGRAEGETPAAHPFFEAEMAYAPNCRRALQAIDAARANRDARNHHPQAAPATFDTPRLLRFIDREMPGTLPDDLAGLCAPYLTTGPRVARAIDPDRPVNIVFFWKQNDSGIYGRRQDMLLNQLLLRPEVGRVLHVDAPIEVTQLRFQPNPMREIAEAERKLISSNTLMRLTGFADEPNVYRRSFVMGQEHHTLLGRKVPGPESFPNAVDTWLDELDMRDNCMAWVCPVVDAFPDVQRRINFPFVVSDYIDDQRFWDNDAARRRALDRNYKFMEDCTDLSIANCQPVADRLAESGQTPLLVPNGIDIRDTPPIPAAEIARLGDKIVGYVGNMNDRFDFDLVESLSRSRPDYQIVLIGKLSHTKQLARMQALPNVHVLGVRRYEMARACIAAFDVAIVPHERSDLSDRMNPLKMYVFRSLGVRVVTTDIANLDDLRDEVAVASTTDNFIWAVDAAMQDRMARGPRPLPEALSRSLSWTARMDRIWPAIDQGLRDRFTGKDTHPGSDKALGDIGADFGLDFGKE
ncbi:glycosyltransferase [Marinibacterium sp. SX1]|uniref:glycosyltransferase n=1 Tax=Marinibacterium sp. SX1 TaxID=3388424 RepID=UPI003D17455F